MKPDRKGRCLRWQPGSDPDQAIRRHVRVISAGGRNYKVEHEHARWISAYRLTELAGAALRKNSPFMQNAITLPAESDECQRALWQDRVELDDGFPRSPRKHLVPVREEAVRAICTRSVTLDVYIWLA